VCKIAQKLLPPIPSQLHMMTRVTSVANEVAMVLAQITDRTEVDYKTALELSQ
jgi:hypothetical protein